MKWLPVLAAFLTGLCGPSARAGLIGTDVTLNYTFSGKPLTTDTFPVTSGVEITCTNPTGNANVCFVLSANVQTIMVGDFSIAYSYTGPGAFFGRVPNGFDFENLNLGEPIASVALTTDISGLESTSIAFTSNSVQIDMTGLFVHGPQSSFRLDLGTAPEPASFVLMCPALALLIVCSQLRRRPAAKILATSGDESFPERLKNRRTGNGIRSPLYHVLPFAFASKNLKEADK